MLAIWRRHNGANNGRILYSRREAQSDLGCGATQAVRYLREAARGRLLPQGGEADPNHLQLDLHGVETGQ